MPRKFKKIRKIEYKTFFKLFLPKKNPKNKNHNTCMVFNKTYMGKRRMISGLQVYKNYENWLNRT